MARSKALSIFFSNKATLLPPVQLPASSQPIDNMRKAADSERSDSVSGQRMTGEHV
jgi:hypothetical protein